MTINFYLDSKYNKKGKKRVICFLRGVVPAKTIYLKTKLVIDPKNWNPEKQCVRKSTNSMENNNYLNLFTEQVSNAVTQYQLEHDIIDYHSLKKFIMDNIFLEAKTKKPTIYEVFDLFMEAKRVELAPSSFQKYIRLIKHLKAFEHKFNCKVTFEAIDDNFHDNFLKYGIEHAKHTNNTIYKLIKQLKTFLYWAYDRNYHKNLKFRKFKSKEDETDHVALSMDEFETLYNLDLSKNTKLKQVRDVFCFQCLTSARYSDVAKFRFEDIVGDHWNLRTKKTRDIIRIYLTDKAKSLLNEYRENNALPVISNQKFNKYLKELCKLAGLDRMCRKTVYRGGNVDESYHTLYELVTTHTGRRTFITISLEKGMQFQNLMKVTGHKKHTSIAKYNKIAQKTVDNELSRVWDE